MKKTLVLLCLLFAGIFFNIKQAKAEVIFEQPAVGGYWYDDIYGNAYFCDYAGDCYKITSSNISPGILTNFLGLNAFSVPDGKVIKSVKLSLAKFADVNDPGRLIMWCDAPTGGSMYYSSQSLKASDLEIDNFKYFAFDFPTSPCTLVRGFYFEIMGGWYNLKVEATQINSKVNYGIGHIQWAGGPDGFGQLTGYENIEPYIQVSDGVFIPPTPPCDLGYSSNYPGIPLPTYDYDPADGLVRFHFKTNGSQFTYRRFNGVCELQYPVLWSQKGDLFNYTPASNNIMYKAKEVKDDSGNFLNYTWQAFNEDTGQELPINLNPASLAFGDPVISIGYFSYTGYPGYSTYVEYSIFSPAVWVKDPNFVAPPPTPTKTPVLIVPGVLGTDILKGDELLWANPTKIANSSDSFMEPLAFNSDLVPIDGSLKVGAVIREKSALIFHSDYINGLILELTSLDIGYEEGKNLFTFPYDWRYGVSGKFEDGTTIIDQLKGQIDYILNKTEEGKKAGKVNVIAHSTGGLLVKKYVLDNPDEHSIDKVVFVGVPNLGAPKAIKTLVKGDNFDVPGLNPDVMKKISYSLPVVYDLIPSEEYYNQAGSFFHISNPLNKLNEQDKDLNYYETIKNLEENTLISKKAMDGSLILHSQQFDNYDIRTRGIDAYNMVGCKNPTLGKFTETIQLNDSPIFDFPKLTSGDKTVPFVSADSLLVDGTKTFFAPQIKHSDLLSSDGPRQQIVNILSGSTLSTNGKILTRNEVLNRPDLCEIKGEDLHIKSPVLIDITDNNGNHSGPMPDGSLENNIPGADYEVWGEHKYVFLPTDEGQTYTINLVGTGAGTFTFNDQAINGDEITKTQVFSNLPVSTSLTGLVNLGSENSPTTLTLKQTPTSTPIIIYPSSILNSNESQDLIPPISTSTIIGLMGQAGFYRSNATITLSALDPVIDGKAEETSGVLKIQYSIDSGEYLIYSTSSPIVITSEGPHSLKFYSTDRAGNNETEQEVSFVIDKTPPELSFSFNPQLKDLEFTATDTLPSLITTTSTSAKIKWPKIPVLKFKDSDNIITATDAAGNTIQLELKDKNRKISMKAEIKSLKYNGQAVNVNNNKLALLWLYDKNGNLDYLLQNAQSKVGFNILAVYNGSKTTLVGKDGKGVINKTLTGLNVLMLSTAKGELNWSIKFVLLPTPPLRSK